MNRVAIKKESELQNPYCLSQYLGMKQIPSNTFSVTIPSLLPHCPEVIKEARLWRGQRCSVLQTLSVTETSEKFRRQSLAGGSSVSTLDFLSKYLGMKPF